MQDEQAPKSNLGLFDEYGRLIPDPTPMAPAIGFNRQPSLAERIRDMVRSEHLRLAAEAAGEDTFEEADDFDVGDDLDPSSPYEGEFDPPLPAPTEAAEPSAPAEVPPQAPASRAPSLPPAGRSKRPASPAQQLDIEDQPQ